MKPILFNTEQVRNILDGRKTNTRRPIKGLPECEFLELEIDPEVCFDGDVEDVKVLRGLWATFEASGDYYCAFPMRKSPYQVGDILYVRETWLRYRSKNSGKDTYYYKANLSSSHLTFKWHPSIHMPREAARIFLKVTDVRVERLQAITLEGIEHEGLYCDPPYTKEHYAYAPGMRLHWLRLWDDLYIKRGYGWESNPWVWVIVFERCGRPTE